MVRSSLSLISEGLGVAIIPVGTQLLLSGFLLNPWVSSLVTWWQLHLKHVYYSVNRGFVSRPRGKGRDFF